MYGILPAVGKNFFCVGTPITFHTPISVRTTVALSAQARADRPSSGMQPPASDCSLLPITLIGCAVPHSVRTAYGWPPRQAIIRPEFGTPTPAGKLSLH